MTTLTLARTGRRSPWLAWLPVAAGLLLLYGPTWATLAGTLWTSDEYSNGPIVGAIVLWLLWRSSGPLLAAPCAPRHALGGVALAGGLAMAIAGRILAAPEVEIASQIPVLAGILLLARGTSALAVAWFPLAFLAFMIPLPGSILGPMTAGLKEWIAVLAEGLLYAAGLPVARDGVAIDIGQYRLFVADACAGLHSMLSLSALGVLYVHLSRRPSILHNAVLLASILPIAFLANLLRVLFLLLTTYWFGDAAARWLHGAAGLSVFVAELALLLALDRLLAWRTARRSARC
jgi:exosortase B